MVRNQSRAQGRRARRSCKEPFMSITRSGGMHPDLLDDPRLAKFVEFCRTLTRDEQIAVVKTFRPGWTVHQIAELCGVSVRTILRSRSYRRLRGVDQSRLPA